MISSEDERKAASVLVQFSFISGLNPLLLQRKDWWDEISSSRVDLRGRKCSSIQRMQCSRDSFSK